MKGASIVISTMLAVLILSALPAFCSITREYTAFEIDIRAENVVNLYGIDIKLSYDTSRLDLIKAQPQPPWAGALIIKNEINERKGTYWLVMAAVAPEEPFSGSAVLARLTFLRLGGEEVSIYLADVKLTDRDGNAIPHTVYGFTISGLLVHDVAVIRISSLQKGCIKGDPIYIDVTVRNQGHFTETFTVTVYADRDASIIGDEVVVGVQTVFDLEPQTSKILRFIWDTTNVPCGVYVLSAKASVVLGEINVENNFLRAGESLGGIYMQPHVVWAMRVTVDFMIAALLVLACIAFFKKCWTL